MSKFRVELGDEVRDRLAMHRDTTRVLGDLLPMLESVAMHALTAQAA